MLRVGLLKGDASLSREKIVDLMSEANDYVSGQWLSEQLGCTRAAVWKQIQSMRAMGYEFESSSRKGYKLVAKPNWIEADSLQNLLTTRAFGRNLKLVNSTESTQQIAHAWFASGAKEGSLVVAEEQTSGKGRMGRMWHSPAGKGIWMSMILQPRIPMQRLPQLTLLAAVALCRSLRMSTGLSPGIKWPNDLLIDDKKLSGILLESAGEDDRLTYIIAGIGINVNLQKSDFPSELQDKTTSLRIEGGKTYKRELILAQFLNEWEPLYELYLHKGFEPIRLLWESYSVTLDRQITLSTLTGTIRGKALRLAADGALMIKTEDGVERAIHAGDIQLSMS